MEALDSKEKITVRQIVKKIIISTKKNPRKTMIIFRIFMTMRLTPSMKIYLTVLWNLLPI